MWGPEDSRVGAGDTAREDPAVTLPVYAQDTDPSHKQEPTRSPLHPVLP